MKKTIVPSSLVIICLAGGALVGDALGQTSTDPGIGDKINTRSKTVQRQGSIPGVPATFDLETRVEVLERQVAELRAQVRQLTAQLHDRDTSYVGPSGRLTLPDASDGKSEYSGPRLKVPNDKK